MFKWWNKSFIELTYTIPNVVELIKHVSENYKDALVGVGSVLNGKMAKDAIDAGASYVVSPGFSDEANTVCHEMTDTRFTRMYDSN